MLSNWKSEEILIPEWHYVQEEDSKPIIIILIVGIKSGEAPEVADIIHERYDAELEMAKSLMQQEFDETIESEQVMRKEL